MKRTWAFVAVGVLAAAAASGQEGGSGPDRARQKEKVRLEMAQVTLDARARMPLEAKLVTGAPYSAEVITESTQVLADGNRIVHRTTGRVYRDAQGRVRREEDAEPGRLVSISITDPVAKVSYFLDPDAKTATQAEGVPGVGVVNFFVRTPSPDPADLERRQVIEEKILAARKAEAEFATVRDMPSKRVESAALPWEETVEKLPARQIEGVMAEGTRTTRTIPTGAIGNERPIVIVSEEWRSSELQVLVMTSTSDPRSGESTYRLANIVRQEPPASYFELPAGYSVTESGIKKVFQLKRDQQ